MNAQPHLERIARLVLAVAMAGIVPSESLTAQQYTYSSIDFPGAVQTSAFGINDSDQVAGTYQDSSGISHGFLWSAGEFESIDYPSSFGSIVSGTVATGINNAGSIVGYYFGGGGDGCHGFLLSGGVFNSFDLASVPGLVCTFPLAINDSGEIAGDYTTAGGYGGFILSNGNLQTVNYPSLPDTNLFSISPSGVVYGEGYTVPTGPSQLFSYFQGSFTPIEMLVYGANLNGDLLLPNGILEGAQFVPIIFPSANATAPHALNNSDAVAGIYWINNNFNVNHAFVALPAGISRLPIFLGGANSPTNPTLLAAEPVNTATGNYYSNHTDLAIKGRGLGFGLQRVYNGLDSYSGPLGPGWTHSYNIRLTVEEDGQVDIKQRDGSVISFSPAGSGAYIPAITGLFDHLVQNSDGSFTLTRKNQVKLNFSAAGQLFTIADRNGNTQVLSYDSSSNLKTVTDTAGRTIVFTYDANNHLVSVADPSGRTVNYTYDASGNLNSVQDALGLVTQYSYDANHRLTSGTDPRGVVYVTNTYDSFGRVILQKNGKGLATSFAYDTPAKGTTQITDPLGNVTLHEYDSNLRISKITDAKGGPTTYAYDGNNDKISVTDANGNTTKFTYDANGNVTSVTDALGKTASFTYDSQNDVLTIAKPSGAMTTFLYDAIGNLNSIQDSLGNKTTFLRNGAGQPTTRTDALGNSWKFGYDPNGDVSQITDPLGDLRKLGYDSISRLTSTTDANGHTTTITYDALGRTILRTDALGNNTQYQYDQVGNLISLIDANGNLTGYQYDNTNNLVKVSDALRNITSYGYDNDDNRVAFTNASGNASTYQYDALNRLIATIDPLGNATDYSYDSLGNLVLLTDAKGQTSNLQYDVLSRLLSVSYADQTNVAYSYNEDGYRTSMVDWTGATSYKYDTLGHLLSVVSPGSNTLSYTYDANGRRSSLAYPNGKVVTYGYDADGRRSSVTDWASQVTRFSYDPAGNLVRTQYPNNSRIDFVHDAANRLTSVTNSTVGVLPLAFNYTLDSDGNRTIVRESGIPTVYTYDALNRLTSAQTFFFKSTWSYDPVGNRLTEAGPLGITNYTYDASDRLLKAGTRTFTYDADGNRISAADALTHTLQTYKFNAANRLVAANGELASVFTYDGDGNRVSQIAGNRTDSYVNDVGRTLPEVLQDVSNVVPPSSYVYGLNLVESYQGLDNDFFQYDGLGSVIQLTDRAGRAELSYFYDAWGNSILPVPPTQPFRFAGQALDVGTGLYYVRARYYDPQIGRFISKDPFLGVTTFPVSLNRYSYALNNPSGLVDRSGFAAEPAGDLGTGLYRSGAIFSGILGGISNPGSSLQGILGTSFGFTPPMGFAPVPFPAPTIRQFPQQPSGPVATTNIFDPVKDCIELGNCLALPYDDCDFGPCGNFPSGSQCDVFDVCTAADNQAPTSFEQIDLWTNTPEPWYFQPPNIDPLDPTGFTSGLDLGW